MIQRLHFHQTIKFAEKEASVFTFTYLRPLGLILSRNTPLLWVVLQSITRSQMLTCDDGEGS